MQTAALERRKKRRRNKPADASFPTSLKRTIIYSPVVIIFLFSAFIVIPSTRPAALWLLDENHPVEMLTFLIAVAGSIFGSLLAWRAKKQGNGPLVFGFYALLSLFLFFVGMEEISWGQQLLGYDTPSIWRAVNLQGETTIHNIAGMQNRSEIFRFIFGLSGLVGVRLNRHPYFKGIGAPAILMPWFAVISLHAGIDIYNDYFPIAERFDFYIHATSELIELLIVFSGLLYFALNSKGLSTARKERRAA